MRECTRGTPRHLLWRGRLADDRRKAGLRNNAPPTVGRLSAILEAAEDCRGQRARQDYPLNPHWLYREEHLPSSAWGRYCYRSVPAPNSPNIRIRVKADE